MSLKDKIKFGCTLCGECCSGSMKVFLNSYDLYKMGRFLGMSHSRELFDRKLVVLDRGQNGLFLPRILFKTKPLSFCPFLTNDYDEELGLRGLCRLHLIHKPLVCRLAPLTRNIDLDSGTDEFDFILPHPGCPGGEEDAWIDPEAEREGLKGELDFELRYYRLLSASEEAPDFLWNFHLGDETGGAAGFEKILKEWEIQISSGQV